MLIIGLSFSFIFIFFLPTHTLWCRGTRSIFWSVSLLALTEVLFWSILTQNSDFLNQKPKKRECKSDESGTPTRVYPGIITCKKKWCPTGTARKNSDDFELRNLVVHTKEKKHNNAETRYTLISTRCNCHFFGSTPIGYKWFEVVCG